MRAARPRREAPGAKKYLHQAAPGVEGRPGRPEAGAALRPRSLWQGAAGKARRGGPADRVPAARHRCESPRADVHVRGRAPQVEGGARRRARAGQTQTKG